jgi:hypothetical protein
LIFAIMIKQNKTKMCSWSLTLLQELSSMNYLSLMFHYQFRRKWCQIYHQNISRGTSKICPSSIPRCCLW